MLPLCMQHKTDLLAYSFPQQKCTNPAAAKQQRIPNLHCYPYLKRNISIVTLHFLKRNLPVYQQVSVPLTQNTIDVVCSFTVLGRNKAKRLCKVKNKKATRTQQNTV